MNRQELAIQEVRFLQGGSTYAALRTGSIGLCHSEMAMHAAKKMRRSRQKLKTGRVVCHHLRMMLAANEAIEPFAPPGSKPVNSLASISRQQNETQFSLGI